ncbi:MAG: hypothetical protein ACFBSF_09320 [Leptolyngbyaceae cyanobacterium]
MPANTWLLILNALLLAIINNLTEVAPANAVRSEGYFFIYSPAELDCDRSYTQLDIVESPIGRQPAAIFCSKLEQGEPLSLGELRRDQLKQRRGIPWGSPYEVSDYLCRDRGSGFETVCLYPTAAENLGWYFIQSP